MGKRTSGMKVWINMPFLIQQEKIGYLERALLSLSRWKVDQMRVIVFVNEANDWLTELAYSLSTKNKDFKIEQVYVAENPLMLLWEHKKYIPEFLASGFTHFIYMDGDIEIPYKVFEYWLETRKLFIKQGYDRFIPGTFRIETYQGIDYASDLTYRTEIDNLPILNIGGKWFFRPQEPFQDVSIMDKVMAKEHLESPYFHPHMDQSIHRFGFGETCISGYILYDVPEGLNHRVLIPLDDYVKCWVYHLPANYAANPDSEHGKIPAYNIFARIKERIK